MSSFRWVLSIIICLLSTLAQAATVQPVQPDLVDMLDRQVDEVWTPLWEVAGQSPCGDNPEECTPAWTLDKAVAVGYYTRTVADGFIELIDDGDPGEPFEVCPGDLIFNTGANDGGPFFVKRQLAAFRDGHCQSGVRWTVTDADGNEHWFGRVHTCSNWVGPADGFGGFYNPETHTPSEAVLAGQVPSSVIGAGLGSEWLAAALAAPFLAETIFNDEPGSQAFGDGEPDAPTKQTGKELAPIPLPASALLLMAPLGLLLSFGRKVA